MNKEISFKTLLNDFSNWLNNKHHTKTSKKASMPDKPAVESTLDDTLNTHQRIQQQTKYDRYHPLYLQDRDVNSHF